MAYYICEICPHLVKEEVIHITGDNKHVHEAVKHFIEKTLEHLKSKGVEILEVIVFTDHCSSQYKNKFSFYEMSNSTI